MYILIKLIVMLVLLLFVIFAPSRRYKLFVGFMMLAGVLNLTTMLANHNRMPVSNWQGDPKLLDDGQHSRLTDQTRFKFLCDVHGNPKKIRYSVGDLFFFFSWTAFLVPKKLLDRRQG
jgi:hypothetical protein